MFYTYILYSATLDCYYKGFSEDVLKRLENHLRGTHKYTSQTRDWKLVYVKDHETKTEALIEEKRLKKLNRKSLEFLIKNDK